MQNTKKQLINKQISSLWDEWDLWRLALSKIPIYFTIFNPVNVIKWFWKRWCISCLWIHPHFRKMKVAPQKVPRRNFDFWCLIVPLTLLIHPENGTILLASNPPNLFFLQHHVNALFVDVAYSNWYIHKAMKSQPSPHCTHSLLLAWYCYIFCIMETQ